MVVQAYHRNTVFLMNPEGKISCKVCNEESGDTKWITRKSAKVHLESKAHEKHLRLQTERNNMKEIRRRARRTESSVQVSLQEPVLPAPKQTVQSGGYLEESSVPASMDYDEIMDVFFGNDHRETVFTAGAVEDEAQKEIE
ncbi:hypothetical protein M422DRAFT_269141 [Sphaerobolus stellatus SS14]|uniref:Uncharacterized protein n=1 Tax=Sphaerobolus stellatus (strain SS14) TaxID=990650 RepID=A0A0C9TIT1_SPHS4|nr:hypothetical protein M422DRAFT_269141 [Sphaerobolus stellatus SS14]